LENIYPVPGASGRIDTFQIIVQDIDARRQMEEALQEANSQLERQVNYLEALYHLRNNLEKARTAATVINDFGHGIVAAAQDKIPMHLTIEHEGQSWSFGSLPAGQGVAYEHPLKWGGQQRGRLSLRCSRVLCKVEKSILLDGSTGLLEQMLEARELELQLLQSSRLVSLGQMAAGVAHELYQPLTAISTTAEDIYLRLLDHLDLPPSQLREMMKDVLEVVERMGEVIEQLRVFSRDTAQEPGSRFSLNAVVQGVLRLIRAQLQSHDIQLVLALAEGLPLVEGHLHQLEQVVLNLLVNAYDALNEKPEGVAKQVVVRTYAQGEQVVLAVEDNGVGMSEEVRLRVFEPFFTTKQVDRGTGLGLSISYAIVRNHHGQITCDSRKGHGATFQITLPAAGQR
jgi:C4-dicarboxylate-specific signal transduction histidine kinase